MYIQDVQFSLSDAEYWLKDSILNELKMWLITEVWQLKGP